MNRQDAKDAKVAHRNESENGDAKRELRAGTRRTMENVRAFFGVWGPRITRRELEAVLALMQNEALRKRALQGQRVSLRGQTISGLSEALAELSKEGHVAVALVDGKEFIEAAPSLGPGSAGPPAELEAAGATTDAGRAREAVKAAAKLGPLDMGIEVPMRAWAHGN